jgi:hypothetical protein
MNLDLLLAVAALDFGGLLVLCLKAIHDGLNSPRYTKRSDDWKPGDPAVYRAYLDRHQEKR